jgi:hypothetical protein
MVAPIAATSLFTIHSYYFLPEATKAEKQAAYERAATEKIKIVDTNMPSYSGASDSKSTNPFAL